MNRPGDRDLRYLRRAMQLARRGAGRVSPNPLVGAVVVRGDTVAGEGYHLYSDRDHAEVVALRRAGERARGATLYINLEPCCHHGRTPPCVEAIIRAGIDRVCLAVRDPNPRVAGRGIRRLQEHGIEVVEGLLAAEAARLNEVFFHFVRQGLPFVLLKLALSLDGKIATAAGESKWITGEASRLQVQRLRYESDGILVGIGTLLQDDPSLDVRWSRRKPILKAILDTHLRTPVQARIFDSGDRVVLFHGPEAEARRRAALAERSELIEVATQSGRLDWDDVLRELAARGICSLLVEGGGRVAASVLRSGRVQKIRFFYGPSLIGCSGMSGIGDLGIHRLADVFRLKDVRLKAFPPDFMLEGYLG